jgi:hypothetical protein
MRSLLVVLGHVVGMYLILRALAEMVLVDYSDPTSYGQDWGGPSLIGVLAVHCLPGLISAVLIARYWLRAPRALTEPKTHAR